MTLQADRLRSERQQFAAPGGAHDRMVHFLNAALPMGVGVVVAVMLVSPLFPRSEVSFLLDRNKVAIVRERLRVSNAMYRGADNQGRAFEVTAGSAVQRSARIPQVDMQDLKAQIQLSDGPAQVAAKAGRYDLDADRVMVDGQLDFSAADGYRMTTRNVGIDLKTRKASGAGGVSGQVPSGTFSADRLNADLANRTVTLDGHARLRMVPGQMRMPK
ncbi:MAG: LPS export ABC transporter periplasmic protein LptC [Sphingomonadales bacterium]|nr:LPS export ABC transporter periplasmic protein LptC [Sphingomonadales bacterium]